MERENLEVGEIFDLLLNSKETMALSQKGFCRFWVREAIELLTSKFPKIKIEVKEVEICEEHWHSFLRLSLENMEPIICDGTGVNKNGPYFGLEKDAPDHLRNWHRDGFILIKSVLT